VNCSGHVPFDGKGENHEWAEILRRVEDDRKRLAQAATVEHRDVPGRLQLEDEVQRQEEEIGGGQRRQVAAGGMPHSRLNPHGQRQQVAGKTDDVPDDGEVAVDGHDTRKMVMVERLHRVVRQTDGLSAGVVTEI